MRLISLLSGLVAVSNIPSTSALMEIKFCNGFDLSGDCITVPDARLENRNCCMYHQMRCEESRE